MTVSRQPFSVLMSLYDGEKCSYFDEAMESVYDDSTLKPDEIVLVIDGPLRAELFSRVAYWKKKNKSLRTVMLIENSGLGVALRAGVIACSHPIIARMDTDDINMPTRFCKQLAFLSSNEEVDIVGGWISEFHDTPLNITGYRVLPETNDEILRFAKWRDPVNHMTVMFRKKAVLVAGNYEPWLWFEDTWLWARMMMSGAKFYNIQEPLVFARVGKAMLSRRKGLAYLRSEIALFTKLFRLHFINVFEYVAHIIIRSCVRLLPYQIVGAFFKIFLRKPPLKKI